MPPKRPFLNESSSEDEDLAGEKRPRRSSKSKIDSNFLKLEQFLAEMKDKKIQVKCNQTGKVFRVKITSLSTLDDTNISKEDIKCGSQLMMDFEKKSYPVTVIKVIDDVRSGARKKKATDDISEVMEQAKLDFSEGSSSMATDETHHKNPQDGESAHIIEALADLQKTMKSLVSVVDKLVTNGTKDEDADSKFLVNGINLKHIPAKDAYSYGRNLLDTLFSKDELASSVVIKSKKSIKPPLSPRRVQLMFDCIDQRYNDKYDHRQMMATLGQKCRDSGRDGNREVTTNVSHGSRRDSQEPNEQD